MATITDTTTRMIIPFGAPSSGKTVILQRLCRYLAKGKKFRPAPDVLFNADDPNYERLCTAFEDNLHEEHAPGSTPALDFMLVQVFEMSKIRYQILEAPGEHYFDPNQLEQPATPMYMQQILNCSAPKLWLVILELDWKTANTRLRYVNRIKNWFSVLPSNRNKVLFVCNQIDKHPQYLVNGKPDVSAIKKAVCAQYPGLLENFTKSYPLIGEVPNYGFCAFSSGSFPEQNGEKMYVEGSDMYPENLFKIIRSRI